MCEMECASARSRNGRARTAAIARHADRVSATDSAIQYHAKFCLTHTVTGSLSERDRETATESCTDMLKAVQAASTATLPGLRLHFLLLTIR